jgi:hypothetical protein
MYHHTRKFPHERDIVPCVKSCVKYRYVRALCSQKSERRSQHRGTSLRTRYVRFHVLPEMLTGGGIFVRDTIPCKLVEHFGGACCFHLQEDPRKITWTWRQQAPLKYWCLYNKLYSCNWTLCSWYILCYGFVVCLLICLIICLSLAHTLCVCRICNINSLWSNSHRDCNCHKYICLVKVSNLHFHLPFSVQHWYYNCTSILMTWKKVTGWWESQMRVGITMFEPSPFCQTL